MRAAAIRPTPIAAMLALTGVLASVLTAQAIRAARGHRRTAERVLRDYAALGADGVAQRLRLALSARFSPALLAAAARSANRAPTAAELQAGLAGTARDVVDSTASVLRVTARDSLANILRAATKELPTYAYFGLRWSVRANDTALMAFQPMRDTTSRVAALELSGSTTRRLLSSIVVSDPVLPSSLTHGDSVARGIGLRMTSGTRLLTDRHFDSSSRFQAIRPLQQPYADIAVSVSLSEAIAPALVIGGLPESRIPLLLTLLVLTVLLTIAAGYQLRRELALSRLRDDFVSSVSHELRTPLAQIRMFAETLRLGRVRTPHESERSLGIIEHEARRLEHLVENLLHFSRAERGALTIHRERVNVTALLQDIAGDFAPVASRADSRIALALAPDVYAEIDAAAVRQVVLNLLDNAVKYGAAPQTITVHLERDGSGVRLSVEDEGIGIPVGERERVWDRFWRGDAARRANITGTGVGLAIVRDVVALHDGRTFAENTARGGARIVVTLPATRRHA